MSMNQKIMFESYNINLQINEAPGHSMISLYGKWQCEISLK